MSVVVYFLFRFLPFHSVLLKHGIGQSQLEPARANQSQLEPARAS